MWLTSWLKRFQGISESILVAGRFSGLSSLFAGGGGRYMSGVSEISLVSKASASVRARGRLKVLSSGIEVG